MTRTTLPLVLLLFCLPLASTRAAPGEKGDDEVCAGTPGLAVSVARHLDFQRRLERRRREGAVPGKATRVYANRKVAVIQGDESLVSPPVAFDLAHRGIQFLPRQDGYAARPTSRPLFTTIGERVELDDTDSVAVALPGWQFPFFGESYGSVYVDADGNLTFGASGADWRHDFQRFLNGPPRIAVFYADLYPPGAHGEAGVYVRTFPNRLRVTWQRVPRALSSPGAATAAGERARVTTRLQAARRRAGLSMIVVSVVQRLFFRRPISALGRSPPWLGAELPAADREEVVSLLHVDPRLRQRGSELGVPVLAAVDPFESIAAVLQSVIAAQEASRDALRPRPIAAEDRSAGRPRRRMRRSGWVSC